MVHATIKDDAENAVKKIEGVEKVVNNIEILSPSPDDDQIRRAEFHWIYGFGPLEKYATRRWPRSISSSKAGT